MYTIKTDQFEGPLDVLLRMIEKNRLDVTRFSLAEVAGEYLNYIEERRHQEEILKNLSQFLWVASGLALLKSKALLPNIEIENNQEGDLEELEQKLKEYKKFKQLKEEIKIKLSKEEEKFEKEEQQEAIEGAKNINQNIFIEKNKLLNYYLRARRDFLETKKQLQKRDWKKEDILNMEEKISQIRTFLKKTSRVSFLKTITNPQDKLEVVVSFLSILELLKQKSVKIEQKDLFADIFIQKN
jgi:segregation and condensation protein A